MAEAAGGTGEELPGREAAELIPSARTLPAPRRHETGAFSTPCSLAFYPVLAQDLPSSEQGHQSVYKTTEAPILGKLVWVRPPPQAKGRQRPAQNTVAHSWADAALQGL